MTSPRPLRRLPASMLLLPLLAGSCGMPVDLNDSSPVRTETRTIERGKAESVRAVLRMDAGELLLAGGAAKLLEAEFRTRHMPEVSYEGGGIRGMLEIKASRKGSWASKGGENKWTLKLDSATPVDLEVHLGAGETALDLSRIVLRSLEVHMGVGELKLNLDGDYDRDVSVEVRGGVGRAEIRLPRKIGAQVEAKGGIGSLKVRGLTQQGDEYVNKALAASTRQVRCKVRGGVGEIELIGDTE